MSGRKSSEVAGVLKQGEAVRRMTDGIYSSQIENDFNALRRTLSQIKEIQAQADGLHPNLSQEARSMFANELEVQNNNFKSLRAELGRLETNDADGDNIRRQLSELDKQLNSADAEAESIRRSIQGKDWYCDEEYARAQALVRQYKKLRDRRVDLQHRMTTGAQTANQRLNQAQEIINRMKNLRATIEDMNEVARKRQQSDAMRNELKQALQSVPSDWAKKFFASEYSTLDAAIKRATADSDDNLIRTFKDVYAQVTAFKTKLDARVEQWKREKADAEMWLGKAEELSKFDLIGPIEYYNEGENGEKTALFEYIRQYGDKDFLTEYQKNMRDAKNALAHEDFTKSVTASKAAAEIVTDARDYAAQLQENMLKKTELAGAIQNVMADLKYNVDLSVLNDNPNDGYKITCSIGDAVIDFDRVDIDNDGKVIVEVDHKESMGGTCKDSWKDIAQRMLDAGIPIVDVKMSGGRSVLRAPKVGTEKINAPGSRSVG